MTEPYTPSMYRVMFVDEWYPNEVLTTVLCDAHVRDYRGGPVTISINIIRAASPDWQECSQCLEDQAQYDSDKRAENRNEQYFHFGHNNY
jgi:hypothetical protein